MLNRIKNIVRWYIPFDDDDVSRLEDISRLQDVAVAAIIKTDDFELLEYLEDNAESVPETERTKWFAKVLRRYDVDIFRESKDAARAEKFVAFYGNPGKTFKG